jgi:hypothetical protein
MKIIGKWDTVVLNKGLGDMAVVIWKWKSAVHEGIRYGRRQRRLEGKFCCRE